MVKKPNGASQRAARGRSLRRLFAILPQHDLRPGLNPFLSLCSDLLWLDIGGFIRNSQVFNEGLIEAGLIIDWEDEHLQRHILLESRGEHEVHPLFSESSVAGATENTDKLHLAETRIVADYSSSGRFFDWRFGVNNLKRWA